MSTEGQKLIQRDKQRRYRERKAFGIRVMPVECEQWVIAELRARGYLDDDILRDHTSTAEAMGRALSDLMTWYRGEGQRPNFWKGFRGTEVMAPYGYVKPQATTAKSTLWRPKDER